MHMGLGHSAPVYCPVSHGGRRVKEATQTRVSCKFVCGCDCAAFTYNHESAASVLKSNDLARIWTILSFSDVSPDLRQMSRRGFERVDVSFAQKSWHWPSPLDRRTMECQDLRFIPPGGEAEELPICKRASCHEDKSWRSFSQGSDYFEFF